MATQLPNKSTSPQSVATIIWMTLPCSGRNHIYLSQIDVEQFSISEVFSSRQACVRLFVCLSGALFVRAPEISFLYRFGGLMRAWDSSPQRRVNLRHLLCTSSIFLDSWHFTSWTNCQLSKLNFRNDMSKYTPPPFPWAPPPPPRLTLPLPRSVLCIYVFASIFLKSIQTHHYKFG